MNSIKSPIFILTLVALVAITIMAILGNLDPETAMASIFGVIAGKLSGLKKKDAILLLALPLISLSACSMIPQKVQNAGIATAKCLMKCAQQCAAQTISNSCKIPQKNSE